MLRADSHASRFALLGAFAALGLSLGATESTPVQQPAMAPPDAAQGHTDFAQLDRDQDGRLTRAEVPADHPLQQRFDALDGNRDGVLDAAEFARQSVG